MSQEKLYRKKRITISNPFHNVHGLNHISSNIYECEEYEEVPSASEMARQIDELRSQTKGLTKREHFAALAMQGILARGDHGNVVRNSLEYADALIAQLNKEQSK